MKDQPSQRGLWNNRFHILSKKGENSRAFDAGAKTKAYEFKFLWAETPFLRHMLSQQWRETRESNSSYFINYTKSQSLPKVWNMLCTQPDDPHFRAEPTKM